MSLALIERYTAFIDILGWSNHAAKAHEDPALAFRMERVILKVADELNRMADRDTSQFSDCIVLSRAVIADDQGEQFQFLFDVAQISKIFLAEGFLVRGGITRGFLHHSNQVCYGQALNRAYELEQKWAIYPRIIIDPALANAGWIEAVGVGKLHDTRASADEAVKGGEEIKTWPVLMEAPDGLKHVNILFDLPIFAKIGRRNYLETVRDQVQQGLQDYQRNPSIFAKYYWMEHEVNNAIARYPSSLEQIDTHYFGH